MKNIKNRKLLILCIILVFILVGCHIGENMEQEQVEISQSKSAEAKGLEGITKDEQLSNESTTITVEGTNSTQISDQRLESEDLIDRMIADMSLEEKVAQLFIVDFYGMTGAYQVNEYNQEVDDFLKNYSVAGVIYFAENIISREPLIQFNIQMQESSSIDMFIAIDEEGGLVSRLGKADVGVTHLDSARDLAQNNSVEEVYSLAYELGLSMGELGFNYDFAPVFDVDTNPDNPVIGDRSFSGEPERVADYGAAFSRGLNEAGIISAAKHFPGHGDTNTDSHLGIASIEHDRERLDTVELVPFVKAIKENIPSIMVGHISAPTLTGDHTPASLSKYMITDLLRNELKYEGVVISDSFRMKAITDYYDEKELGILFLEAGGDLILIPNSFKTTYEGILEGIEEGRLTEERINLSVKRILQMKLDFGIITEE